MSFQADARWTGMVMVPTGSLACRVLGELVSPVASCEAGSDVAER